MATTRRPKAPAPSKPIAREGDPGVLFLRNMPADVMEGLTAWVEQIKSSSIGTANITRTDLARDIVTRIVRGQPVEPRRSP